VPSLWSPRRLAVAGFLIGLWVLYFACRGIGAPFTGDDLMNLHGHLARGLPGLLLDNLHYWSTSFRPLGGVAYVSIYTVAGFHPLPFRIACFLLLGLNLALLFRFLRALSGRDEVAVAGLLLVSYHAWFVDLYFSTGTLYELLCYAFYLGAFLYYLKLRKGGAIPGGRGLAVFCALYVCALNSKEMAVTLPVMVGLYEALYHPPEGGWRGWLTWPVREGRAMLVSGLLTLPYVIGKTSGAGNLTENPAFQFAVSPVRYLKTFHLYLNPFFYQDHVFHDSNTVQLLLAMLLLALWRRSRAMLFGWSFLLVTLLPVAFLNHYAAFFLYLPAAGWALYAGEVLGLVRRALSCVLLRFTGQTREGTATVGLLLVVASVLGPAHARERLKTERAFLAAQIPTRAISAQLLREHPTLRRGARVLFVGDPYPKQYYDLAFLTQLLYADPTIEVHRTAVEAVPPEGLEGFDAVIALK
jgi:hypothetical protein